MTSLTIDNVAPAEIPAAWKKKPEFESMKKYKMFTVIITSEASEEKMPTEEHFSS